MSKTMKSVAFALFVAFGAASVPIARAQRSAAPAAPLAHVPAEIRTAKTIFIANLGGGCDPYAPSGGSYLATVSPDRAYETFYDAMEKWGRFQISDGPADSQLIFEVSVPCRVPDPRLRLVIRDTKSNTALWTIDVYIEGSTLKRSYAKSWNKGMETLLSRLKELVGTGAKTPAPQSSSPPPSKER